MKHTILILFVLIVQIETKAQLPNDEEIRTGLRLLNQKEFNQLSAICASNERIKSWFEPFLVSAGGDFALSNTLIEGIDLWKMQDSTLKQKLMVLKMENYFHLFDYNRALEAVETCISLKGISEEDKLDFTNMRSILTALKNTPAQTNDLTESETIIKYKKDLAGLLRVPVKFEDANFNFIFDTGANISVISKSNATEAGITILGESIDVKGASGDISKAELGVARELHIGKLKFSNVVFLVFPDKLLSFSGGAYKIPGIIGLPVIRQMKSIEIAQNDELKIRSIQKDSLHYQNLYLFENKLWIDAKINDTIHTFFFDFGDRNTSLNSRAIATFSKESLIKDSKKVTGVGGSSKSETFVVKYVEITINQILAHFESVSIFSTENVGKAKKEFFGTLGNDILKFAKAITFDFVNYRFNLIE